MTARIDVLEAAQTREWSQVLAECPAHDFYHLAGYHALAEARGEGRAHLFVFRHETLTIALPFLLRPVEKIPGLEEAGAGWNDANSVYGYPGPIASGECSAPAVHAFQCALHDALARLRVVSLFSRIHPLLPQRPLIAGLGEIVPAGTTVSIDLTLPAQEQRRRMRGETRRATETARKAGLVCIEDRERTHLDRFISIYRETMERVNAGAYYHFDRAYFDDLLAALGDSARLFVVLSGGEVAAAALFSFHGSLVQYHLSGTARDFLRAAPNKLLIDEARIVAAREGRACLHLGGGLGGQDDSLFFFKKGFSDRRHEFAVWRWILNESAYERLAATRVQCSPREGKSFAPGNYFPSYRAPASSRPPLEVIPASQVAEWRAALARSVSHDVYHLPEYHALAESRGEGAGRLFAWTNGEYSIALPLLLRPLKGLPGLDGDGENWQDASSIYGYAGPLSSHAEVPPEIVQQFQEALRPALLAERIVTVFSRLHPLLPQAPILAGLGECTPNGLTVSIDVTSTLEQQRAGYRRNHRRDVRSLIESGVTCTIEPLEDHLDIFIEIYHATMRRTNATAGYFFERPYFNALAEAWRGAMELFVCKHQGTIVCAGLYTALGSIAQAHLAGTAEGAGALAPMKLMYDAAADWARSRGCAALHMGGGVGAQEDSLFRFKQGFSPRTHQFMTWRWIVDEPMHARLCEARARWNETHGLEPGSASYFPLYRSPGVQPAPAIGV